MDVGTQQQSCTGKNDEANGCFFVVRNHMVNETM